MQDWDKEIVDLIGRERTREARRLAKLAQVQKHKERQKQSEARLKFLHKQEHEKRWALQETKWKRKRLEDIERSLDEAYIELIKKQKVKEISRKLDSESIGKFRGSLIRVILDIEAWDTNRALVRLRLADKKRTEVRLRNAGKKRKASKKKTSMRVTGKRRIGEKTKNLIRMAIKKQQLAKKMSKVLLSSISRFFLLGVGGQTITLSTLRNLSDPSQNSFKERRYSGTV